MNKKTFLNIVIIIVTILSSCVNSHYKYKDFDWVYYDSKSIDGLGYYSLGGHKCEYLLSIDSSLIYIKSRCNNKCDVLNRQGEIIDTIPFTKTKGMTNLNKIDSTKNYVWNTWIFKAKIKDTSLISNVEYISTPTESLKLLSGRRPKREHKINYTINGKSRSIILPITSGYKSVYDIQQYSSNLILISITASIDKVVNQPKHYVVMLDLEDLARRRFLGMKL